MNRIVSMLVLLLLAWGISADETAREKGARLLQPFKQELQQTLRAGMASGTVAAIEHCHVKAPQIAAAHTTSVSAVGRTGERLRNPGNAAPEWVEPLLEHYRDHSDQSPATVALGDGKMGYVEPIYLKPLCLNCHGAQLAPDVAERIATLYPDDRATGFQIGDLRGVFWLEFTP